MPETLGHCPVPNCTYTASPSSSSSKSSPQRRLYTHLCQQRKAGCQAHLSFNYTHYRPRVLRAVVATWTPDQRAAHQRARGRERARRFRERKKDGGTAGDQDRDYILREVGEVLGRTSAGDGDDADRVVHGLMRQIEVCGVDSAVILERLVGELAKSKSAEEEEDEDGEEAVVCQQRQRQQQTVLDWSDV